MSLVNLYAVNRTPGDWIVWSYSNQAEHILVSNAMFIQKGIRIQFYPLDPIPPELKSGAPGPTWLYNHQQWHNQINSALNTPGFDLTSIDFSREDQAEAWAWLHSREHVNWTLVLGAG